MDKNASHISHSTEIGYVAINNSKKEMKKEGMIVRNDKMPFDLCAMHILNMNSFLQKLIE